MTALIPLPLFRNPDEQGRREPIQDEHFVQTAEEITEMFHGGGTLWFFRDGQVRGFWWDRGAVDKDVHALLEFDIEDTAANRERVRTYVKLIGPVETWTVKDDEEVE